MFDGIKSTFRKVVRRLRGLKALQDDPDNIILISPEMEKAIDKWLMMYKDQPPWKGQEVQTQNLAARISSEIARLTTIEMKSEITDTNASELEGEESEEREADTRASFLNRPYQEVVDDARIFVELGAALGGIVLKPYISDIAMEKLSVDYVRADRYYPTAFNAKKEMTGCQFVEKLAKNEKYYTRIEHHELHGTDYTITNTAYKSDKSDELGTTIKLSSVEEWAGLEDSLTLTGVQRPLWGHFKTPLANNIDLSSPLPVSCFSRATELIEEADLQYSRMLWEFESGKRALHLSQDAFIRNPHTGELVVPNTRLYQTFNIHGGEDGESFYKDWTPEIRVEEFNKGLNEILAKIEDACGLARGTIAKADEVTVRTATEMRILQQRTFSTIVDNQKALQNALEGLIYAMNYWTSYANLAPEGEYSVSFEFDDSVVADRSVEFTERMQLVQLGAMSEVEMRAWYMGITVEKAEATMPAAPKPNYFNDE